MPDTSGDLVTTSGQPLGRHQGVHNFTIGQRKGLGVSSPNPLYVLNIDKSSRQVTVGGETELNTPTLHVHRLNWIAIPGLDHPLRAQVKIRHVHEPSPALLEPLGDGKLRVTFDTPQRAITPGHSAVFYNGDEVLGGGWIY